LVVVGPEEPLKDFAEKVKKDVGDDEFNWEKVFPIPDELGDSRSPTIILGGTPKIDEEGAITQERSDYLKKEYGADNWYDWSCDNWGTKWHPKNAGSVSPCVYDNGRDKDMWIVTVKFDTAWSPPLGVFKRFVSEFPLLAFSLDYREEGGEFEGMITGAAGEIVEDKNWDIHGKGYDEILYGELLTLLHTHEGEEECLK